MELISRLRRANCVGFGVGTGWLPEHVLTLISAWIINHVTGSGIMASVPLQQLGWIWINASRESKLIIKPKTKRGTTEPSAYFIGYYIETKSMQFLNYHYCPASRTTLVATRFRVAVICPIIQVPHCIRVFFYFVWFVFINHIFQFYYELCTYCNILDIYLS